MSNFGIFQNGKVTWGPPLGSHLAEEESPEWAKTSCLHPDSESEASQKDLTVTDTVTGLCHGQSHSCQHTNVMVTIGY